MKHLIWLASFPKSGNTWVRAFLTAYQNGPRAEFDINHLNASLHAADRSLFDRIVGFSASDMTLAEIDRLRPVVYRALNAEAKAQVFFKVHDAWRRHDQGGAVFPADATRFAIYVVRNPLAVVPSFADHYGCTLDEAIDRMASGNHVIAKPGRGLKSQLPQPMGSWCDHVASWLSQDELPVLMLRYEDLHADPVGQFTTLLEAAGLPLDVERFEWALEQSRFDRLQAAEADKGFRERLATGTRFFRRGRTDAWREELTAKQIARIVSHHGDWMQRLGYSLEESILPNEENMK